MLAWLPLSHACADDHAPIHIPDNPQSPDSGIRIAQLLVERNGKRLPVTAWSPCATDRGGVRIVATLQSGPDAFFSERTLIAVLMMDAMVAPPEYKGEDLEQAERDLHWTTLQAIQTPGVRLVDEVRPSSRVAVKFPTTPVGPALESFDPKEDGLRVLALRVRVQIANGSLDRLVDHHEVVRVKQCDAKQKFEEAGKAK